MEYDRLPTKISRIQAIYIRVRYILKYIIIFRTLFRVKYPVFIVGCGNSGTSILLSILGNHSKIYAIPDESYIFYDKIKNIFKLLSLWIYDTKSKNKSIILEKTPRHLHCIDSIKQIFPHSKFIFITRDCRDTVLSMMKRGFDLNESLCRWVDDNSVIANHKNETDSIKVKYENLVTEKELNFKNICRFIEVLFEKEMLINTNRKKTFYTQYKNLESEPKESEHIQRRNYQINQNLKDYSGSWKLKQNYKVVQYIMKNECVVELMKHFNYIN